MGQHFEEVPGRITEVHSPASVPVIDGARLSHSWICPVLDSILDEPCICGVEQFFVDAERVVLELDIVEWRFRELNKRAVGELNVEEEPPRRGFW